jgi:hypothetical protein
VCGGLTNIFVCGGLTNMATGAKATNMKLITKNFSQIEEGFARRFDFISVESVLDSVLIAD